MVKVKVMKKPRILLLLQLCPGFSWDRVNFHKKLAGLTQTGDQMGCSIPCDVTLSIYVGSWLKERLLLLRSKLGIGW